MLTAQNKEAQNQLSEIKADSEQKQRHTELTQKLYAKVQIDIEQLRKQYQKKYISEQQLVDLVNELRIKLQCAAKYYNLLEKEHPELIEINTPDYVADLVSLTSTTKANNGNVKQMKGKTRKGKTRKGRMKK